MLEKKCGFDFYHSLGSPQHVVAPMVDASELAWRMMSRKYDAHLCYTPMWHAAVFVKDARYRKLCMADFNSEDRPLIVQVSHYHKFRSEEHLRVIRDKI